NALPNSKIDAVWTANHPAQKQVETLRGPGAQRRWKQMVEPSLPTQRPAQGLHWHVAQGCREAAQGGAQVLMTLQLLPKQRLEAPPAAKRATDSEQEHAEIRCDVEAVDEAVEQSTRPCQV